MDKELLCYFFIIITYNIVYVLKLYLTLPYLSSGDKLYNFARFFTNTLKNDVLNFQSVSHSFFKLFLINTTINLNESKELFIKIKLCIKSKLITTRIMTNLINLNYLT
ncbi:hypothetical protein LPB138_05355 [Urechidicola croceus]|uniref:Uncharacterized protein n=1 Tax=Urechidicola croceus TaxID=1850246 RepID=A0A1D8P6D6_9FLAO|nr:hypothetical protein LPB138_05355 [Urechidicola croceus]